MGESGIRFAAVVVMAGFLILAGCVSSTSCGKSSPKNTPAETASAPEIKNVIQAVYLSENGARLAASFDTKAGTVKVTLPSGRAITLPRAVSGSGARYSNDRETFWEHHGEASYWIGEIRVFQGKVEGPQ